MAKQETSEQAQERILSIQAGTIKRLEKNLVYDSLDYIHQDLLLESLTPQLFNPKQAISQHLRNIQISKTIIHASNMFALRAPEHSELCAEVVEAERVCIQDELVEIKRIQRGEFEWVIR